ncbi:hypothetical protein [Thermoplasma volcanium]|uniref:hypothetical protein n=1 Tax=Thermoplasma volcanium TaxID=50339 RepID=UPI0000164E6D|nr:hypothetical protein [Thermoplasma volcanium]
MTELGEAKKCISIDESDIELIDSDEDLRYHFSVLFDTCQKYQDLLRQKAELESRYAAIKFSLYSALEDMKRVAIQISAMVEDAKMKDIDVPEGVIKQAVYLIDRYMVIRED